jgi:hypothetical protein
VETGLTRDDVDIVIAGIFDINRRLGRITLEVSAIRRLLEENGEEEEGDEEAANG